ncbi:MAG: FMN-binding protein [Spirochaetes bacterium]|nr:FMN-binding protein [Spirochaetota bacterium]
MAKKLFFICIAALLSLGIAVGSYANENLVVVSARGTNGHSQADNVFLSVVFDRGTGRITAINYNPLAPENNTTATRAENVGRPGQTAGVPSFMRHLTPWRSNRDAIISQMIGMDARVLAGMSNVSVTGAAAAAIQFDGRTIDAVSGATMTRNSFINAVIEASRLFAAQ